MKVELEIEEVARDARLFVTTAWWKTPASRTRTAPPCASGAATHEARLGRHEGARRKINADLARTLENKKRSAVVKPDWL